MSNKAERLAKWTGCSPFTQQVEGSTPTGGRGGRVERWYWVNFQCLLIWIIVGLGPTSLAVGAGGGCLDIFSLIYHFSFLSPFLWETARYRLKYCLKGPLSPKQPTNQSTGGTCPNNFSDPIYQDIRTHCALNWKIVVSEWRSVIAVSLNVGGGVRLQTGKTVHVHANTLQTRRGRTHGPGCAWPWLRTVEPLGEGRYEH